MANAPDQDERSNEYHRPDAAAAWRIYNQQIKPKKVFIAEKRGDLSEPYSQIKDECHFPRSVLDFVVRLHDMEDTKRDHNLLALNLLLKEAGIVMPRDLVTMADGTDGESIIPAGERPRPRLATVPSDGTETDLADAAKDPAPGTGAAAIAAMNEAAAQG